MTLSVASANIGLSTRTRRSLFGQGMLIIHFFTPQLRRGIEVGRDKQKLQLKKILRAEEEDLRDLEYVNSRDNRKLFISPISA